MGIPYLNPALLFWVIEFEFHVTPFRFSPVLHQKKCSPTASFFFFLVFLFQSHGSYEPLDSYDVRVDLSVTENENPVRSCSSPPRSALSFSAFFLIFYSSHTC